MKDFKSGLSGYLVLLRHMNDDLPVAFFADESEAFVYLGALDPMPTDEIRNVYTTDCSSPVCGKIVKFVDGEPKEILSGGMKYDE